MQDMILCYKDRFNAGERFDISHAVRKPKQKAGGTEHISIRRGSGKDGDGAQTILYGHSCFGT